MSTILSREALGHIASLGDLYDARTDNFLKTSIFNQKIPDAAIALIDNNFSDIRFDISDTYSEKFSKMNVTAELQVSVLAELFSLEGSGRYLNDKKTSARMAKSTLLYNIKTKVESLNIYHDDLKSIFALPAIETGMATHVVIGISWGANTILTSKYLNKDSRNVTTGIEGELTAQLKNIEKSIKGRADVSFQKGDKNKEVKFDIHLYGDILPNDEDLPTTFEQALKIMKKMPSLVNTSNKGRGKPLTYALLPIDHLNKYLKLSVSTETMIQSLAEDSLRRVVQLFENISEIK